VCTNNILANKQYGFRIKSCTDSAAYIVDDEILEAMNNRLSQGGIFCDVEKVFDCVDNGILVDKLEVYGISGKFLWYNRIAEVDTKKYSWVKLMHMIVFLLDGKSYKWGPSMFDLVFITSSYL